MNLFQKLFTISLLSDLFIVSDVLGFSPMGLVQADAVRNNAEFQDGLKDLLVDDEITLKVHQIKL